MRKIKKRFDKKATRAQTRNINGAILSPSKRSQLNISFGWLFAIIVGATILVLTIYGASKIIKGGQTTQQAVGAKELGILLNPLETGFESAVSTPLSVPVETRIENYCDSSGDFGEQRISISEESFNKFPEQGVEVGFENKYIFSRSRIEGKNFYVFSKPFEFPFKVTDVIYLTSSKEEYCFDFEGAPEDIKDEITGLNQTNLAPNCEDKEDHIKICFKGACDIRVDYNAKSVKKPGKDPIYFEGDALMYAAIFSDEIVYKCQVERLLKRTRELAFLYKEKALLMSQRNCDTYLEGSLSSLISNLEEIEDYFEVGRVSPLVQDIGDSNEGSGCKLW